MGKFLPPFLREEIKTRLFDLGRAELAKILYTKRDRISEEDRSWFRARRFQRNLASGAVYRKIFERSRGENNRERTTARIVGNVSRVLRPSTCQVFVEIGARIVESSQDRRRKDRRTTRAVSPTHVQRNSSHWNSSKIRTKERRTLRLASPRVAAKRLLRVIRA